MAPPAQRLGQHGNSIFGFGPGQAPAMPCLSSAQEHTMQSLVLPTPYESKGAVSDISVRGQTEPDPPQL
jgi:hypothetical protein